MDAQSSGSSHYGGSPKRRRLERATATDLSEENNTQADQHVLDLSLTKNEDMRSQCDAVNDGCESGPFEGIIMLKENSHKMQVYHPETDSCFDLQKIDGRMLILAVSAIAVKDTLLLFMRDKSMFSLRFCNESPAWEQRPSMNDFHDIPGVALGDSIYLLGANDQSPNTCERFDIQRDEWTMIPHMCYDVSYHCIVSTSEHIYTIGGEINNEEQRSVEKYDPKTQQWSFVASMNRGRSTKGWVSAVMLREKIYVTDERRSGDISTLEVECYEPENNVWTIIRTTTLQVPFFVTKTCTANGNIYGAAQDKGVNPGMRNLAMCIVKLSADGMEWTRIRHLSALNLSEDIFFVPIRLPSRLVSIHCGNVQRISIEKLLTEKSQFFKAMFLHDMSEKRTGVVNLHGLDSGALQSCVEYMHKGVLPQIEYHSVESLIHASQMLCLEALTENAERYMETQLSVEKFVSVKRLAHMYNLDTLDEACDSFALSHFEDITKTEYFVQVEPMYLLFLLLHRPKGDMSEAQAFEAIKRWIGHDEGKRSKHFDKLFLRLNLKKFPSSVLGTILKEESLVRNSRKLCMRIRRTIDKMTEKCEVLLVMEKSSLTFKGIVHNQAKLKDFQAIPKLPEDKPIADNLLLTVALEEIVYIVTKDCSCYKLKFMDQERTWAPVASMPDHENTSVSAVTAEGSIYVFGDKAAEKYDPKLDCWSTISNLAVKIKYTLVEACGSIYALGGKDDDNDDGSGSSSVVRYEPASDKWHYDVTPMSFRRLDLTAAVLGSRIFVLGKQWVPEMYDIAGNTWTTLPQSTRGFCSLACAIGGKIFVFGNRTANRESVEIFDPEKKTWKSRSWRNCEYIRTSAVTVKVPYEKIM